MNGGAVERVRNSRADRWSYENFKPVTFRSAWPLAERYEALLRVFNDPTKYAQRLARRLHATPHRVGEVLNYTADSWAKVSPETMVVLGPPISDALKRWDSS